MRLVPVLIASCLLASCGGSRDDAERKARAAREAVAAKAREHEEGIVARAVQAKNAAVALKDRVLDGVDLGPAAKLAREAKAELDKVYRSNTAYDLDVTTAAASTAHAAELAALPHVKVGGVTVGYEQVSGVSLTGPTSKRHFRATWRRGDRDVIVSYKTDSQLDVVAFAALLSKLVPIVDRLL